MFKLVSPFEAMGDQPRAISEIIEGIEKKIKYQTLLGITGSGKTFTMAKVIDALQKPTLVLVHNKTLAAQLYKELKDFFPYNSVTYFVSYFDFYQPEAYLPHKDLFIEKSTLINEEIEQLRLASTSALLSRKDVIVVASVAAIYEISSAEIYQKMSIPIAVGQKWKRKDFIYRLHDIQYEQNMFQRKPGVYQVRGSFIDIFLSGMTLQIRVLFSEDDVIESILVLDPISSDVLDKKEDYIIYPAKQFVTDPISMQESIRRIQEELKERIRFFESENEPLKAQRIKERVNYDLDMMREVGYCRSIENYSRHMQLEEEGYTPHTIIDYFPKDFLCFIDESHMTIPQLGAMFYGNYSRKKSLIDYGFRLPSAMDHRPLKFEEFEQKISKGYTIFVSATPGRYEMTHTSRLIKLEIRPTGLLDPSIEIQPTLSQKEHLLGAIRERKQRNERVLITTLTKKFAESLSEYLRKFGIKVNYLHSEVDNIDRVRILTDLRKGTYDVIVGINLLREGIDLPEVSLVAILDADKKGFLRSTSSLIQIIGRAARNSNGHVIMYADEITSSMQEAITITEERRKKQQAFNEQNGIIPQTIQKKTEDILEIKVSREKKSQLSEMDFQFWKKQFKLSDPTQKELYRKKVEDLMFQFSKEWNFIEAAECKKELERLASS